VLVTDKTSLHFQGVKQVARLTRTREILKYNKKTSEQIFLITDIHHNSLTAQNFLSLKRDYWGIENSLHYRKDFVFGEDRSTIRVNFGPQNISSLRNFAIGVLLANDITNVKRCVDNLKHNQLCLLKLAA
jgi:predicted transposase YbfD/YdcC